MIYTCANCGGLSHNDEDFLDSGTVLQCNLCNGNTIVDLWFPSDRNAFYKKSECL